LKSDGRDLLQGAIPAVVWRN